MRVLSMTVVLLAALSLAGCSNEVKGEREMSARKASPEHRGSKAPKVIRATRATREIPGRRVRLSGLWQRSRRRPHARPTK